MCLYLTVKLLDKVTHNWLIMTVLAIPKGVIVSGEPCITYNC